MTASSKSKTRGSQSGGAKSSTPHMTLGAILELIAADDFGWPMTAKEFEQKTGLKGSASRMWLAKLKLNNKYLVQWEDRRYALPHMEEVPPEPVADLPEALLAWNKALSWPMTRMQFLRELKAYAASGKDGMQPVEDDEAKRVLNQLIQAGAVLTLNTRLLAHPESYVAKNPDALPVALGSDADQRLRFPLLLTRLPVVFTSAQFIEAGQTDENGNPALHPLDSRHAGSVLSRLASEGKVKRLSRGLYERLYSPLPLTFTVLQFAAHFGVGTAEAEKHLNVLVNEKRVAPTKDGLYKIKAAELEKLEEQLRGDITVPFDHAGYRQRQAEVPELKWPMLVEDYAKLYGLTVTAARVSLNRFVMIGLLKQEGKVGHAHLYDLNTTPPLVKVSPKEAQNALNNLNGSTGSRRIKRELQTSAPK